MTRINQPRAYYANPDTPKPKPFEEMINQAIAATGIDPDDFYANINGDTLSLLTTVAEMPQEEMTLGYSKRLAKIFPSTTLEQWCKDNPSRDIQSINKLVSDNLFRPDWNDPAHNTLQDYMVENHISPEEMASKLGISIRGLISIFADEVPIDKNLAQKLSEVCGNSPEFWLKRQAQFDHSPRVNGEQGDPLTDTATAIANECDAIKAMLLDKNRKYGNSALNPVRIFSKANPLEQINVRADDKLSRIQSGQLDDDEDPERDLIGYLILKRVAIANQRQP